MHAPPLWPLPRAAQRAPQREQTPPLVPDLLGELVELNRSLTATERFLGSARSNEYTGDGPSGGRLPHPQPAALPGFATFLLPAKSASGYNICLAANSRETSLPFIE